MSTAAANSSAPQITTLADLPAGTAARLRGGLRDGRFPLCANATGLIGSLIDDSVGIIAAQSHDVVRFAMGSPAPEAIPSATLRAHAAEALADDAFTYGETEGEPALIEQIVALTGTSGINTHPDRIIVTNGGMQALDLAFKILIDPGDLVAVESPTYTNGSATALAYGADILEVPVDDDGMDVDALESLCAEIGRTPKAIYTIPNFQNPSGVTLSEARRVRLLELAHEWGSMIIDDDPYGELRFSGDAVPGFGALSPMDPHVFSARTFSKTIAPGLRIGWADVDASLRPLLTSAKQALDSCSSVPGQHLVTAFLASGEYDAHIASLRASYRERKDAMRAAFAELLPDRVRLTDPAGGFFLWATLLGDDAQISTEALFDIALAEGVAFIPGPALSPAGAFSDSLRLCFASSSPERTREGVERFRRALDRAASVR